MREILFRAKTTGDEPRWIEGYYYYDGTHWIAGNPINPDYDFWETLPINPETLGQFTGIYDRNNVRVFEGDILKARMTDAYTVVFNRGSFMGEYTSPIGGYTVRVDLLKDDWEVIGNIYDNPELLEGGIK